MAGSQQPELAVEAVGGKSDDRRDDQACSSSPGACAVGEWQLLVHILYCRYTYMLYIHTYYKYMYTPESTIDGVHRLHVMRPAILAHVSDTSTETGKPSFPVWK